MDDKTNREVIVFINQLKEKGIPLIIEYKNNDITKIFYKPAGNEWFGIAVLEEGERIFEDQKYCGLLLSEVNGVVDTGMYDVDINGNHWGTLRIEDLDLYIQNGWDEAKWMHEIFMGIKTKTGEMKQPFDLHSDVILKDHYMSVYCKKKKDAGVKITCY